MKIVFLVRLYKPHIGGVEKHVEKLSREMVRLGHQITIVTTQHESSLSPEEEVNGIKIYRIPKDYGQKKLKVWWWLITNRSLLHYVDLVHAHDVYWWYLPLRMLWPKLPSYTTFHGWEGKFPPSIKAKIWRKLAEILSRKNICVGEFIGKWYGTRPDLITYGATDQTPLAPGNTNSVSVIGRLSNDNNMHEVIEALKSVQTQYSKLHIRFIGDGQCAWEAARVGQVFGFVDNISHQFEASQWIICSSYLTILDALAAGRTIFSIYTNPLKHDYLTTHPQAASLNIASNYQDLAGMLLAQLGSTRLNTNKIKTGQEWALSQTWSKLAGEYLKLWG
jgi:glycosyltransferase involved in cell wall biosynthesis